MITSNAYIEVEKQISSSLFLLSVKIEKYRPWLPGMFMQIALTQKSASEPWLDSRAFSFASWGTQNARILVRKGGMFTSELIEKAREGFYTSVKYPFGDFLLSTRGQKIFIAGGAGISVFLSYIDYAIANKYPEKAVIFHSSKNIKENIFTFYPHSFWESGDMMKSIKIYYAITNDQDPNYTGRLNIHNLINTIKDYEHYNYYLCGPAEFVKYWIEALSEQGIKVYSEIWKKQYAVKL